MIAYRLLTNGKAEAVYGNNREHVIYNNEFRAGMHRLKIIYRNSKDSLINHTFKHGTAYSKVNALVNGGKLRELLSLDAYYAIFGGAALDSGHAFFVAGNFDVLGIKAADYV